MARPPRFVAPWRLMHGRPAGVEQRARIGGWEGDLIVVGRTSRSAIGSLVGRRTGYPRLVHLPDGHSDQGPRDGLPPKRRARRSPGHVMDVEMAGRTGQRPDDQATPP